MLENVKIHTIIGTSNNSSASFAQQTIKNTRCNVRYFRTKSKRLRKIDLIKNKRIFFQLNRKIH